MNERTAPKKRHRRTIGTLIAFAILLFAAYPLAANVFLAMGGVEKALSGTDQVAVHFRRAWSFWPGRVHVEGARITMHDRNVQFALVLDSVDVDIDLWAFARRTFHATRVRGSGVSFRFRNRIDHEEAGLPFVAALPPIPEFADPPLRELGPPPPPLEEAHYDLWTVHVEDVDVTVRELWAETMRYEGEAHVVGAFRLRPAKRLWVGPAELELRSGSLTSGPYDVLRGMRGKLTGKVDDFDTESVQGMEPFRFISARLALGAEVASLDVVNFLSEPSPSYELHDGSGLLDLDVAIDHGVFTPAARLAYRTGHVAVWNEKLPFRLDGEIDLLGSGPALQPGGHLRLAIPRANLVVASRHRAPELHRVEVELDTSNADVTKEFPLTRSEANIGDIVLPELAWLGDLPFEHPHSWKIKGGRGHIGGVATLHQPSQAIDASFSAGFSAAAVTTEAFRVIGAADVLATAHVGVDRGATVKGRVVSDKLEIATETAVARLVGHAIVDADLAFSPRGAIAGQILADSGEWIGDTGSSRFSGSALAGNARFEANTVTANATVIGLKTSVIDACPWAQAEQASIAARIEMPEDGGTRGDALGTLSGATLLWGGFEAHAPQTSLLVRFSPSLFSAKLDASGLAMKNVGGAPRSWHSDVESLVASTDLALGDKSAGGTARIDIRKASGQVGKTNVQADLVAMLDLHASDWAHRKADVSGRVQARNVILATGERKLENWWASVDLDRAKVDIGKDFDVSGRVKARFRDGLPALYVLASDAEIPSFVPSLFPLEGISLNLGVERYCRWTDVQIHEARGGALAAEGRIQVEPGETRGTVLLRLAALKPLSLGLHFAEDYSDAAPLVGSSWLEKRLVLLTSAATEKHDQRCIPQPPTCH